MRAGQARSQRLYFVSLWKASARANNPCEKLFFAFHNYITNKPPIARWLICYDFTLLVSGIFDVCLCCTNFRASDLSPVWVLYYIAWLCAISVFYDDVAACFRIYTTQVNNLSWVVIFLPLWIFQIPQMYTLTMRSSHWLGLNIPYFIEYKAMMNAS